MVVSSLLSGGFFTFEWWFLHVETGGGPEAFMLGLVIKQSFPKEELLPGHGAGSETTMFLAGHST